MATQPMTKFVVNATVAMLYLKAPSDEQLEAVLTWLTDKQIDMVTCLEGQAIFTKTGKGKPSPAIAIQFQSQINHDTVAATMAELYPAPKSLTGIKLTDHEVTDPVTDMPIAPVQDDDQLAAHMDAVAADATAHADQLIAAVSSELQQVFEPAPLGDDDETRCYTVAELQTAKNSTSDDVPF